MPEPWTTIFALVVAAAGFWHGLGRWGRQVSLARLGAAVAFGYCVPLVAIHWIGSFHYPRAGALGMPWALGVAWFALLATALASAHRLEEGLSKGPSSAGRLAWLTGLVFAVMEMYWDQVLISTGRIRFLVPSLAHYGGTYSPGLFAFHFAAGYLFARIPAQVEGSLWRRGGATFLAMTVLPLGVVALSMADPAAVGDLARALPPWALMPTDALLACLGAALMCGVPVTLASSVVGWNPNWSSVSGR